MKFLLCLSILLTVNAHAKTNKVGNGGDVVDCGSDERIKLLDFYEGDLEPSLKGDEFEIASQVIERLQGFAPKLKEQYAARLKSIREELEIKAGVELSDLDDSKHLFKPLSSNCKVVQIAIRRNEITDGEKRFLIRKDLWDRASANHKAGLLLHEIIYEHLYKLGDENSVKARKLNRLLFASDLTGETFWKTVRQLKVSIYP